MENSVRHIDQAMFEITKYFKENGMAKTCTNSHGGYKYRSVDQIMQALSYMMVNHNLRHKCETVSCDIVKNETTAKGTKIYTNIIVLCELHFISLKDGSKEIIKQYGCANMSNNNDRALQGAVSDAQKYAFIRAFCIPTQGMPDPDSGSDDNNQKQSPPPVKEKQTFTDDTLKNALPTIQDLKANHKDMNIIYEKFMQTANKAYIVPDDMINKIQNAIIEA